MLPAEATEQGTLESVGRRAFSYGAFAEMAKRYNITRLKSSLTNGHEVPGPIGFG
jgi:hypothetical protein